jgi:hypothetical protein
MRRIDTRDKDRKTPKATDGMRAHSVPMLRLATACHPDMPNAERHRILSAVAADTRDAHWIRVLRGRAPGGADPALAMRMLDAYERPGPERAGAGGATGARCLAAGLVLLLVVWAWVARVRASRSP